MVDNPSNQGNPQQQQPALQDMLTDWRDSIGFAWPSAPPQIIKLEEDAGWVRRSPQSPRDTSEDEEEDSSSSPSPTPSSSHETYHQVDRIKKSNGLIGWPAGSPPVPPGPPSVPPAVVPTAAASAGIPGPSYFTTTTQQQQPLLYIETSAPQQQQLKQSQSWDSGSLKLLGDSSPGSTTGGGTTPGSTSNSTWDPTPYFTAISSSSSAAAAGNDYSGNDTTSTSGSSPSSSVRRHDYNTESYVRSNNSSTNGSRQQYWTVENSNAEWGGCYDDPPPQNVGGGVDPAEAAAAAVAALHQQHPDRPLLASIPEAAALLSLDCLTPEYRRLLKNIPRKSREAMTPSDEAAFRTCHPQYSKNCYILMHLGYDIRLGESGRAALKKEISRRLKNDAQLREKCVSIVCRLKNANVLQLLQMAEISGCLLLGLRISSTYWRDYAKKQRPGVRRNNIYDEGGSTNNYSIVESGSSGNPVSANSAATAAVTTTTTAAAGGGGGPATAVIVHPHSTANNNGTTHTTSTTSPTTTSTSTNASTPTNTYPQYDYYYHREKRPNPCDIMPPIKKQNSEDLLSKSAAVWGDYNTCTPSWLEKDLLLGSTTTAPGQPSFMDWNNNNNNNTYDNRIIESEEYSDSGPIS